MNPEMTSNVSTFKVWVEGQRHEHTEGSMVLNSLAVFLGALVLLFLSLFLSAAPSQAAGLIRYVDHAYGYDAGNTCTNANYPCQTIQNAVNVAQPYDIIRVTGGLYYENIVIDRNKPKLTIQGGWGLPGQGFSQRNVDVWPTEISGSKVGPVFTLEAVGSVIDVTIDGCWLVDGSAQRGGAISALAMNDPYSSPMGNLGIIKLTLSNCRIEDNTAVYDGGAIYAVAEEPLYGLSDNSVELILSDNLIAYNKSAYGKGGAVCIEAQGSSDGRLTLKGNQIRHNQARNGGGVSVMKNYGENALKVDMENNIIADNKATIGSGGGLAAYYAVDLLSVNDTITNNDKGQWGYGNGVYLANDNNSEFVNAIIWGNQGDSVLVTNADIYVRYSTTVNFSYSDVGRIACRQAYTDNVTIQPSGTGNVSVDPGFVSPETGDYHLQENSPVRSAGICGTFIGSYKSRIAPLEDFEGDRRPNPGNLQCKYYRYDWSTGKYTCAEGTYTGCSMGADDRQALPTLWTSPTKLNPVVKIPYP